ncbi:MAG: response regulator [Spirochaetales bacterium]|nr:response regulator [Spirochaetales bacterium]
MYNVLIVDDEKPVRVAVSALGEWDRWDLGEPATARNGREALKLMEQEHRDIVFVDMNMPLMNGITFLERARKEYPGTKFIVISGYDDFSYAHAAIRNGVLDYILKPVVAEELNEALAKAVKGLNQDNHIYTVSSGDSLTTERTAEAVKECIDNHYTENISLTQLSEQYSLSKEYLCKIFKKKYGMGIYQYLLQVRMEKAAELLQEDRLKIQEIAELLGFSDNNYFSKAFRKFYDTSPTRFRRQNPEKSGS